MVVEEWLAEDFPLKIDQSTNTTKFTSCASRWDALIEFKARLRKSNSERYAVATLTPIHCTACMRSLALELHFALHARKFTLNFHSIAWTH